MAVVIKVSEDVRERLVKLAGELQAKTGKRVTLNDVIKYLLDTHEEINSEGIDKELEDLQIKMDKNSSMKVDEVVYGKQ
ncbi:antitoxin VapB [Acidianus hospitalis]|jgi:predicted transcriptional regulator|uniref:VapB-type antitoxin n=1 Tax=Acidianus hospitalis (strain W1) TaxID=933801 RepID=F4B5I3_ACIHW|nr:antitoxin VapB [Acidianus hospitalis]AEE94407.1 VapB-type antitoxin [Acidianus hospitalis W1]